jgi:hypothetical protein
MRLHNPDDKLALPFYVRWDLAISNEGKASWRFHSARAQNGQRLNWNDIKTYLHDPSVIYPEPPEGEQDDQEGTDTRAEGQIGAGVESAH